MFTLGLSGLYHDSAAVLLRNTEVIGAIQEERLSRLKGDNRFPSESIRRLLRDHHVEPSEIRVAAWYEKPRKKARRKWVTQLAETPAGFLQFESVWHSRGESKNVRRHMNQSDLAGLPKVRSFLHHHSHAASAYFASSFEESAVLIVDGIGEWASTTIARALDTKIIPTHQTFFPHSLGLFFAAMTSYCGFKVNSGEYKLMGLAPYGEPTFANLVKENLLRIFEDGSLALNMKFFGFTRGLNMYNQKLISLLGFPPRQPEESIGPRYCDLAASVQYLLNECMTRLASFALSTSKSKRLCLAGGVALNCVSNSQLKDRLGINEIFVQPAAGDSGGALGAGYLGLLQSQPNLVRSDFVPMKNVFLGTQYTAAEIRDTILELGLEYLRFEDQHDSFCRNVAMLLDQERVVGWFSHRMEFGPRSLGARSILGDPRSQKMQKLMNLRIKFRESFRPFAPSVLETHVGHYFEWSSSSPFMLFTAQVKGLNQDKIDDHTGAALDSSLGKVQQSSPLPAITHIDGSARIQTVSLVDPLYPVIKAFEARTGVPVLINTSFNVRGEPIVESPRDAINCFLSTDIDALAIYPYLVLKSDQVGLKKVTTKPFAWGLD